MPFPNLEGKHAGRPYVTARGLLGYHESRGSARDPAPRAVVLTWQARLEDRVRERRDHQALHSAGVGSVLLRLTPDLGLARLPIGAPAAAIAVEELSARGTEVFIGIGTAGAINERLAVGDLAVCSAALRDEGTSHHYARPEPFALPDPGLTARLREALPAAAHGPSWTTDAPYRETAEEIADYRAEGILTVEMEASCLFTVARSTGTAAAAAFVISDVLHGEQWEPRFGSADILAGLWTLFEAAEACLAS
ncbi:MAG TPA: nucleoside phosphorylase [Streptosporangiaceae bacterium]|nr:nucleoside phosphorylase [Streptosporangiaceae bacterium]